MSKYKIKDQIPNSGDWLQETKNGMHNKNNDPLGDLSNHIEGVPHHSSSEPGITHPFNSSSVKIKDNGMIHIFVSTNQGIVVDPNSKTVNIIANTTNIRTNDYRAWVSNHSITNVRKNFEVNADSNFIVNTGKNIDLNAKGQWNVNIIGDVNIHTESNAHVTAKGKIEVESESDINVNAGATMNFKAKGSMWFDAPDYNWR